MNGSWGKYEKIVNWTQLLKMQGWENSKHLSGTDLDDQADDITSLPVPDSISARSRSEIGAFWDFVHSTHKRARIEALKNKPKTKPD